MELATLGFARENAAISDTLPSFSANVSLLGTNVGAQGVILARLEADIRAVTESKGVDKQDAIDTGLVLSKKLVALAKVSKNVELARLASAPKLDKMADGVLQAKLVQLNQLGVEYKAAAAAFGVTDDMLDDQLSKALNFLEAIPKPRMSKSDVKKLNQEFTQLQKESVEILDVMDAIVDSEKETQPGFWQGYFNVRTIVDIGGRHLALKVQVNDAESGEGVGAVKLEFILQTSEGKEASTDLMKSVKWTGPKGISNVDTLDAGTYLIRASKEGYVTQTVTAYVNEGELTRVVIEMVKI